MFLEGTREDKQVVQAYDTVLPLEPREEGVHYPLERCRCRKKSKWHCLELVEAIRRDEGSLLPASLVDFDLAVASV